MCVGVLGCGCSCMVSIEEGVARSSSGVCIYKVVGYGYMYIYIYIQVVGGCGVVGLCGG